MESSEPWYLIEPVLKKQRKKGMDIRENESVKEFSQVQITKGNEGGRKKRVI